MYGFCVFGFQFPEPPKQLCLGNSDCFCPKPQICIPWLESTEGWNLKPEWTTIPVKPRLLEANTVIMFCSSFFCMLMQFELVHIDLDRWTIIDQLLFALSWPCRIGRYLIYGTDFHLCSWMLSETWLSQFNVFAGQVANSPLLLSAETYCLRT